MFKKMSLKKEIKKLKERIIEIENKRSRSQSSLVSAILEQKEPDENDVEFFNNYTTQINELRQQMMVKEKELASL